MIRRLWVIERYAADGVWFPTSEVGFTRDEARNMIFDCMERDPQEKYRVREYRPYGDNAG